MITSPRDAALDELCGLLAAHSGELRSVDDWPREQLARCAEAGVLAWFVPRELGGLGWSEVEQVEGYLRLSASCLTTTFILTQVVGAVRRIALSGGDAAHGEAARALLPELLAGRKWATVGISHLTTSRRHLAKPVLRAEETERGVRLDGYSPWVTGARQCDYVVIGATLDDGRQLLACLPTALPGVSCPPPLELVALSASQTGEVRLDGVELGREWLLAEPQLNVMSRGEGARTGGLQTSTLAVGLAGAAIGYLDREGIERQNLASPAAGLRQEWTTLKGDLLAAAAGHSSRTNDSLRAAANRLALRATQAALAAAKGAGFVATHPTGRWCREALFFLVWSCPQPVLEANLCELAGLGSNL